MIEEIIPIFRCEVELIERISSKFILDLARKASTRVDPRYVVLSPFPLLEAIPHQPGHPHIEITRLYIMWPFEFSIATFRVSIVTVLDWWPFATKTQWRVTEGVHTMPLYLKLIFEGGEIVFLRTCVAFLAFAGCRIGFFAD